MRAKIFKNKADDAAFEKILHEGLQIHHVELFSYLLMPNVNLRPNSTSDLRLKRYQLI